MNSATAQKPYFLLGKEYLQMDLPAFYQFSAELKKTGEPKLRHCSLLFLAMSFKIQEKPWAGQHAGYPSGISLVLEAMAAPALNYTPENGCTWTENTGEYLRKRLIHAKNSSA